MLLRSGYLSFVLCLTLFCGCRDEMFDQPKCESLEENVSFKDGMASRPLPLHTVPRGFLKEDQQFHTGWNGTNELDQLPMQLTAEMLRNARTQFDVYCAICHGITGDGDGPVVQRGFAAPASFHTDRQREAPIGHTFEVITHGYGVMPSLATKLDAAERWGIASYVRVLQFSRSASVTNVPQSERECLEAQAR
jgi:hypothetical protein